MNRWGIPANLERFVLNRDKRCVYCGVRFSKKRSRTRARSAVASWEHIINDMRIITRENIALCCTACNASKGAKKLADWLDSDYCKLRGITRSRVAPVIKRALKLG